MKTITRTELLSLLSYDPSSGVFRWRQSGKGRRVDLIAGSISKSDGYVYICIKYRKFSCARLAWLYVYGKMPDEEMDHINRIRSDNRLSNIRSCTRHQNAMNQKRRTDNSTGHSGVYNDIRGGWRVWVHVEGKPRWIGRFPSFDDAVKARREAEKRHYGRFTPER